LESFFLFNRFCSPGPLSSDRSPFYRRRSARGSSLLRYFFFFSCAFRVFPYPRIFLFPRPLSLLIAPVVISEFILSVDPFSVFSVNSHIPWIAFGFLSVKDGLIPFCLVVSRNPPKSSIPSRVLSYEKLDSPSWRGLPPRKIGLPEFLWLLDSTSVFRLNGSFHSKENTPLTTEPPPSWTVFVALFRQVYRGLPGCKHSFGCHVVSEFF